MAKSTPALDALRAGEGCGPIDRGDDVLKVTGASPAIPRRVAKAEEYDADDVATKPIEVDSLKALQLLAEEMIMATRDVVAANNALRRSQERLADVAEHRLPDLMEEHQLPKFEFFDRTTGLTLTIKLEKDKYRVSMPAMKDDQGNPLPENFELRKAIYDWLREIGQGGSIKKNVEVAAGLISDDDCKALMEEIVAAHPAFDVGLTEKVEPATLTALVSRLLKAGKKVHEGIQVKPVRQAKVSKK